MNCTEERLVLQLKEQEGFADWMLNWISIDVRGIYTCYEPDSSVIYDGCLPRKAVEALNNSTFGA